MDAFAYKALAVLADSGIYCLLALGLAVAFRITRFPDLTAEGSFTLGAVSLYLLVDAGYGTVTALVVSTLAGASAGLVTAGFHLVLRVPNILAGILTWMALYSLNLSVLGSPNERLPEQAVLGFSDLPSGSLLDRIASANLSIWLVAAAAIFASWVLLESASGLRLRCATANPHMARTLGLRPPRYTAGGLALANALIGLAGGLFAAKAGYVDVNMGGGMLVAGIATLFMGAAFVPGASTLRLVGAAITGTLAYRILVALALEAGLDPVYLRLLTAILVVGGLSLSRLRGGASNGFSLDEVPLR